MKIILMSDSHGYDQRVREVVESNPNADYYLHCGDLSSDSRLHPEVVFVKGNNDYFEDFPLERILDFDGIKAYMFHSHTIGPRNIYKYAGNLAKEKGCKLVFYGHTHRYDDRIMDGVRFLNPGSLFYNRDNKPIGYYEIIIDDKTKELTVNTKYI